MTEFYHKSATDSSINSVSDISNQKRKCFQIIFAVSCVLNAVNGFCIDNKLINKNNQFEHLQL